MHAFTRFTNVSVLVLLTAIAGCAGTPAAPAHVIDPPATALVAHYPNSDALKATLETHAEGGSGRPRDNVLMTTWFPSADARIGYWSTVDTAGHVAMYRFTHDWGFGAAEQAQLTEIQFPELKQMLPMLPLTDSAHLPPVEQLLLVSFRRSDLQWVTRAYDRANLPPAVQHLFEVTGASIDVTADHR